MDENSNDTVNDEYIKFILVLVIVIVAIFFKDFMITIFSILGAIIFYLIISRERLIHQINEINYQNDAVTWLCDHCRLEFATQFEAEKHEQKCQKSYGNRKSSRYTQTINSQLTRLPKKKSFAGVCSYCNRKIKRDMKTFCCHYCYNWYCSKHRLPETHKCRGSVNNPHKFSGRFKFSKDKGWEYLGNE